MNFNKGDRVKLSYGAIQARVYRSVYRGVDASARRGEVVMVRPGDTVIVRWHGNKTARPIFIGFLERVQ